MRRYELMLLLRPDLEDDKLQAAVEKVTRAIVNGGGSLAKVSPWGKRRLAYDIGRHREASYFLIHFDIEPGQVREIERGMLISEEILRHLVTVLEDRGPAEELPPAAVARGAGEGSPVAERGSAEPAPEAGEEAKEPAAEAGEEAHEPQTDIQTTEGDAGDQAGQAADAGEQPVDEERAAG